MVLQSAYDASFPLKTRTTKSTDAPWINNGTKKKIARKQRIYKQEGKSERYVAARKESDEAVEVAKKVFLEKVKKKVLEVKNTKAYCSTVKILGTNEAPELGMCSVCSPGEC